LNLWIALGIVRCFCSMPGVLPVLISDNQGQRRSEQKDLGLFAE
jgi:hypothetical protein